MRYSQLRVLPAKHMRKIVIAACVVAALVAAGLTLSWPARSINRSASGPVIGYVQVNRQAPPFSLPDLAGRGNVRLSTFSGKPAIINFWSSSCEPCKQESPAIAQVARAMGDRVAFLGIDTFDVRSAAAAFVKRYHVTYPVIYDPQGFAAGKYRVPALPETFFLARTGKQILGINLGALTVSHLMSILHTLYGITL